eukprot:365307-Chlamydomonas_euryale.AAC.1
MWRRESAGGSGGREGEGGMWRRESADLMRLKVGHAAHCIRVYARGQVGARGRGGEGGEGGGEGRAESKLDAHRGGARAALHLCVCMRVGGVRRGGGKGGRGGRRGW